jgi:hypothetical protein
MHMGLHRLKEVLVAKAMNSAPAARSLGVTDLVDTVERLGSGDQERMLKVVILLSHAPRQIQKITQSMLKELLEEPPQTAGECAAEIDAVIDFLKQHTPHSELRLGFDAVTNPPDGMYN